MNWNINLVLSQLVNAFNHIENMGKGSFLRVNYPENIILEKEGFRTNSENYIVELITRFFNGSQILEMKKATLSNGFSNVAPPLGESCSFDAMIIYLTIRKTKS